eukprot:TRINITY_DN6086_c0_g1_i2.p1 TRINITY_DN6086_c0_g1~~TRINITY_DN6086_c0_g1_i2.p1  ORF type:complete len:467 (+),score=102.37 TRINITY_DN6086_c0_g1_i2:37-1437(+)
MESQGYMDMNEREKRLVAELEEERAKNAKLQAELDSKIRRIRELEAEMGRLGKAPVLSLQSDSGNTAQVSELPSESSISDEIWDACAISFYDSLCADPTVQRFFRGTKFSSLKRGQWCFFKDLWQGKDMEMDGSLHQIWDITHADFNRFLDIFKQVLSVHASEASVTSFVQRLDSFRHKVVSVDSEIGSSACDISQDFSLQSQQPEELAGYLKQLFMSELHDDPDQVPPDQCLQHMARYLLDASTLSPNQRLSTSHLQIPHSKCYISETRCSRLRAVLAAHPTMGISSIMQAWDDAAIEVTNKGRTRARLALQRQQCGKSSLTNSVTICNTVNAWYANMKKDEVMSRFFERNSSSSEQVARRQFDFIHRMALASKTFQEEQQATHLRAIHRPLVIKDSHFDRFVSCLMRCCRHSKDLSDDFVSFIEKFRPVVVRRAISDYDAKEGAACPVTGKNQGNGTCPFQASS